MTASKTGGLVVKPFRFENETYIRMSLSGEAVGEYVALSTISTTDEEFEDEFEDDVEMAMIQGESDLDRLDGCPKQQQKSKISKEPTGWSNYALLLFLCKLNPINLNYYFTLGRFHAGNPTWPHFRFNPVFT